MLLVFSVYALKYRAKTPQHHLYSLLYKYGSFNKPTSGRRGTQGRWIMPRF